MSSAAFVIVLASIAVAVRGCAPGDGSLPTAQKTVKATFLPPTAWTFPPSGGEREFDQMTSEDAAGRRLVADVKAAIYEAADEYSTSGVSIRILKVERTLKPADLSGADVVLRNDNQTVAMIGGSYFTYDASVDLQATLPLPGNQWESLVNSLELKLIREGNVEFNAPGCGVTLV